MEVILMAKNIEGNYFCNENDCNDFGCDDSVCGGDTRTCEICGCDDGSN